MKDLIILHTKKQLGAQDTVESQVSEPSTSIFEDGDGNSAWEGDGSCGEECDIGVDPLEVKQKTCIQ